MANGTVGRRSDLSLAQKPSEIIDLIERKKQADQESAQGAELYVGKNGEVKLLLESSVNGFVGKHKFKKLASRDACKHAENNREIVKAFNLSIQSTEVNPVLRKDCAASAVQVPTLWNGAIFRHAVDEISTLPDTQEFSTVLNAVAGRDLPFSVAADAWKGDFSFLNQALVGEPVDQIRTLGQAYAQLSVFNDVLATVDEEVSGLCKTIDEDQTKDENKKAAYEKIIGGLCKKSENITLLRDKLYGQITVLRENLKQEPLLSRRLEVSDKNQSSSLETALSEALNRENIKHLAEKNGVNIAEYSPDELELLSVSVHFALKTLTEESIRGLGVEELKRKANDAIIEGLHNRNSLQQGVKEYGGPVKHAVRTLLNAALPNTGLASDKDKADVARALETLNAFIGGRSSLATAVSLGKYHSASANERSALLSSVVGSALKETGPVEAFLKLDRAFSSGSPFQAALISAHKKNPPFSGLNDVPEKHTKAAKKELVELLSPIVASLSKTAGVNNPMDCWLTDVPRMEEAGQGTPAGTDWDMLVKGYAEAIYMKDFFDGNNTSPNQSYDMALSEDESRLKQLYEYACICEERIKALNKDVNESREGCGDDLSSWYESDGAKEMLEEQKCLIKIQGYIFNRASEVKDRPLLSLFPWELKASDSGVSTLDSVLLNSLSDEHINDLAQCNGVDLSNRSTEEIELIKASVRFKLGVVEGVETETEEKLKQRADKAIVKSLEYYKKQWESEDWAGGNAIEVERVKVRDAVSSLLDALLPTPWKVENTSSKEDVKHAIEVLRELFSGKSHFTKAVTLGEYQRQVAAERQMLFSIVVDSALKERGLSSAEALARLKGAMCGGSALQSIWVGADKAARQVFAQDETLESFTGSFGNIHSALLEIVSGLAQKANVKNPTHYLSEGLYSTGDTRYGDQAPGYDKQGVTDWEQMIFENELDTFKKECLDIAQSAIRRNHDDVAPVQRDIAIERVSDNPKKQRALFGLLLSGKVEGEEERETILQGIKALTDETVALVRTHSENLGEFDAAQALTDEKRAALFVGVRKNREELQVMRLLDELHEGGYLDYGQGCGIDVPQSLLTALDQQTLNIASSASDRCGIGGRSVLAQRGLFKEKKEPDDESIDDCIEDSIDGLILIFGLFRRNSGIAESRTIRVGIDALASEVAVLVDNVGDEIKEESYLRRVSEEYISYQETAGISSPASDFLLNALKTRQIRSDQI